MEAQTDMTFESSEKPYTKVRFIKVKKYCGYRLRHAARLLGY